MLSRVPRRARPRTSTSSSSTAGSSRRCATRSTRTRTRRCTSPTRSSSTSPRSTPRRPRSSPTSRTASPPTVILRTIDRAPSASRRGSRWCRRRSASGSPPQPGTSAYGVPSVLAQLACDVRSCARSRATSSHPVPNVDSVLVGLERHGPAPPSRRCARSCSRASRTAARRSRARSSLAPGADRELRDRARAALEALGHPADARAETLAPGRVARAVGSACADRARARQGQPLPARRRAARRDGLHPLVSVVQPVSLADELTLEPAGARDEVVCPGVDGDEPRGPRARRVPRGDRLGRPPQRITIAKRIPVAAGMGGGSADAAAAAPAARVAGRRRSRSCTSSRCASAPTSRACCSPGRGR